MQRVFTRDVGRNFKRGEARDLPMPTWTGIAASEGKPLDAFSRPVDEALKAMGGNKK